MEEYKDWVKKAKDDLNWTKHNFESKIYCGACFTAQQAAEKVLKGYLIFSGKPLRKIHDLAALIDDCIKINKEFNLLRKEAKILYSYYIESRYPDLGIFSKITEVQAKEAFKSAEKIIKFVEEKIEEKK